jgi:hypothetical protein
MLQKSSTQAHTSSSLRTLLDPLEGGSAVLERRQLVGLHASLGVWCEYLGSGVHCSPSILPMSCVHMVEYGSIWFETRQGVPRRFGTLLPACPSQLPAQAQVRDNSWVRAIKSSAHAKSPTNVICQPNTGMARTVTGKATGIKSKLFNLDEYISRPAHTLQDT